MQQRRTIMQKITVNAFFLETGFSLRILALIKFATTSKLSETLHNFSYLQFFCPGKGSYKICSVLICLNYCTVYMFYAVL